MRLQSVSTAIIVGLCFGLSSCKPDPTVRYQNAPEGAAPTVKVINLNVTPNSPSLFQSEVDTSTTVGAEYGTELLLWGRADHPAGIAKMKMTLIHEGSVANVANFNQPAAFGSNVTNPLTIYGSDGLGGVGALRPFTFKLTDDNYSVILTAADAAGHTRTITVKYVVVNRTGGGGSIPTYGGGTTNNSSGSNTSTGPTCKCPDPNNKACGSPYGATCTTSAECAPGLRCGTDPLRGPGTSCVKIENGCPEVTCWKPEDLSYNREQCFTPK